MWILKIREIIIGEVSGKADIVFGEVSGKADIVGGFGQSEIAMEYRWGYVFVLSVGE